MKSHFENLSCESLMRNSSGLRLNLKSMLAKEVFIKVRLFNTYLKGTLTSFDHYSNILLENVTEYEKNRETHEFSQKAVYDGPIILRGDSIITLGTGM
jgi:small nuclear ribonucleoprotein (snRNP)-like protein